MANHFQHEAIDLMRVEIDTMKNWMDAQTIQNGALSAALTAAKDRITKLEANVVMNVARKAPKEHLPKRTLHRARALEFKAAIVVPLKAPGQLRDPVVLTMGPWKTQVIQHP